ncbi:MAG TPA: hypothetical protein VK918_02585 [Pyrinomonadaceae bacterium]|nr:hypothetical protein [Pyrinomonadaceae bacterium]
MKNTKEKFLSIGLALMLLTLAPGIQNGAFGQDEFVGRDPHSNAIHSRIVGVWDVQVTGRNCITEEPISSFPAMHKYELGGTGQVVPATNPASYSAHMTIWEHVRKDDYLMTVKMFRFDAAGNYIGWVVIRNSINITNGVYSGYGVAQFYDIAGNEVGMVCPTFEGTRFE